MAVLRNLPVLALAGVVTAAGAVHAQDGEIGGKITFYTHFTNFVDNGKWAVVGQFEISATRFL